MDGGQSHLAVWADNRSRREDLGARRERIAPHDGLRALTIDAAYQYGEEDRKGSIETGKLADLTILDANPTTVDVAAIKDIKVSETIKEGKTIYKRGA